MIEQKNKNDDGWHYRGPGGTQGGLGSFVLGFLLAGAGTYLLMNQVQVGGGYWLWWGPNTFGLTLLPLAIGIGLLFFNGRSIWGWALAALGLVIIIAGILANLHIYIRPTSLYDFIVILVLMAGGFGLMARSLTNR